MSLKITETITKEGKYRKFDSYNEKIDQNNWFFEYLTRDINGNDQTDTKLPIDTNKDNYPIGTIFFDSEPETIYASSSIKNVVIDSTPPEFISENVQYMVFKTDHTCEFNIQSDTLLDISQLAIVCGNDILYYMSRKFDKPIISNNISDIKFNKNGNNYTLSFKINNHYNVNDLNNNQITITIWDIAANKASYTTKNNWIVFNSDIKNLQNLTIEFINIEPENKIVSPTIEGKVLVKVTNYNIELRDIMPTVELINNSVGYLDINTLTYDKDTGVLLFYVTSIKNNGSLNIAAWITADNKDIIDVVKKQTYIENTLGPFILVEEGRVYKLMSYVPKYLNNDDYYKFIQFVEEFLNTSQTSLTTGNCVSTLEKIARINDFKDPYKIENPLLNEYRNYFNIEINPKLEEYMYYLNHKRSVRS